MELILHKIPIKQRDHGPFYVAPIGDIQWSGKNGPTAKESLKRHIDRCLELNAWYVGMGDFTDCFSPSNRARLQSANLYDTATDTIDEKMLELVHEVYDEFLRPTKGRWLGLLEGHHWAQLKSGETTDQRLAQLLKAPFLGSSAYINLQFRIYGAKLPVVFWVHHGCGGGMTPGAPLNRLDKVASRFEGADVFIMGHTTRAPADRIPRPFPVWTARPKPKLVHREALLVNAGGFAKSYVEFSQQGRTPRGGYAEQRMLPPSSIGAPLIEIRPYIQNRSHQVNGKQISRRRMWMPEIKVIL